MAARQMSILTQFHLHLANNVQIRENLTMLKIDASLMLIVLLSLTLVMDNALKYVLLPPRFSMLIPVMINVPTQHFQFVMIQPRTVFLALVDLQPILLWMKQIEYALITSIIVRSIRFQMKMENVKIVQRVKNLTRVELYVRMILPIPLADS
jgi:hypothetical protein